MTPTTDPCGICRQPASEAFRCGDRALWICPTCATSLFSLAAFLADVSSSAAGHLVTEHLKRQQEGGPN